MILLVMLMYMLLMIQYGQCENHKFYHVRFLSALVKAVMSSD